jgi:ribonuclease HII
VRARLSAVIREQALAWNLGMAEPGEIDALNIRRATLTAMVRAVRGLRIAPDLVLVDGRDTIDVGARCIAVVGGDCRSQCVAAASILAKVTRDELMTEMDRLYPGYGFAQHKGYPTPQHLEALRRLGPCSIHRLTFRGVG